MPLPTRMSVRSISTNLHLPYSDKMASSEASLLPGWLSPSRYILHSLPLPRRLLEWVLPQCVYDRVTYKGASEQVMGGRLETRISRLCVANLGNSRPIAKICALIRKILTHNSLRPDLFRGPK
jgi:hypothetical protein